ncbi:uncharacterized protein [Dysidea avara]|uniref:uncharacterized protein n=1 Tax=Dysidea avara TaxID=196820 RepID=UPI00332EBB1E
MFTNFFGGKQYSYNLSCCISREFQTTLIAAVMEAQNPQLCKDVCNSYLFYGDICWFSVPESAATPQTLSALSYCIAHSERKWMIQCKGLNFCEADNLLKYLICSEAPGCRCGKCAEYRGRVDSSICVFDVISSQNQINGSLKLIKMQKCLQWLILSYCKYVDDKFVSELAEALAKNVSLTMLHLIGCNISSYGMNKLTQMLKKNKTLEWIGLANNRSTLAEGDIIMLLQTIRYHNNTVFMLFLDNAFHTSDKVQEQLQILDHTREQRGVQKISLTLLDCFKYHETCQRIISNVPFMKNEASPSSVITKDLQSQQQITVHFGEYPIKMMCPKCREEMATKITFKIGSLTWLLVMVMFFAFLWP